MSGQDEYWEDDNSDDEEETPERVVCIRCMTYRLPAIDTIVRGPTWLRDCPNAFSTLWTRMTHSFFATATTHYDISRTKSLKDLIGLHGVNLPAILPIHGFSPVGYGMGSGGFIGKTVGGHWLAFTIVAIHRDKVDTNKPNTCRQLATDSDDDTCYTTRQTSYIKEHRTFWNCIDSKTEKEEWAAQFEFRSDNALMLKSLHEPNFSVISFTT